MATLRISATGPGSSESSCSNMAQPELQLAQFSVSDVEELEVERTTIHSLPVEILPIIFEAGIDSLSTEPLRDNRDEPASSTPVALASVNRLWRHLCLSNASLWTSISIHANSRSNFLHKQNLAELMIARSKNLDLMIKCTIDVNEDLDEVDDQERALLQLLVQHAHRWYTASFALSRALVSSLFPIPSLPRLRGIYLDITGRVTIPRISQFCPSLTTLLLGPQNGLGKETFPWEQITELTVVGSYAPSLSMLGWMTNLHTYKIPAIKSGIAVESHFPGDEVMLPNLKVLQIEGGWEIYNSELTTCLGGVITPALVELHVPHYFSPLDYHRTLSTSTCLEQLTVGVDANNPFPAVRLQSPVTSVKDFHLHLRFPRARNWDSFRVDHAFQEVIHHDLPQSFPSIQTLRITLGIIRADGTLFGAPSRIEDVTRVAVALLSFCSLVATQNVSPDLRSVHLVVLGCTPEMEQWVQAAENEQIHPLFHISSRLKSIP